MNIEMNEAYQELDKEMLKNIEEIKNKLSRKMCYLTQAKIVFDITTDLINTVPDDEAIPQLAWMINKFVIQPELDKLRN